MDDTCSFMDDTTWMNPRGIMLSRSSQTRKVTSILWLYLYELSITGKSIETEGKLMVGRGWNGWVTTYQEQRFSWASWNSWNLIQAIVAQHCECKFHWIVYFQMANLCYTNVKNKKVKKWGYLHVPVSNILGCWLSGYPTVKWGAPPKSAYL